ncbi:MAG: DUF4421 family protein [Paludibacteraceae bacterium]|nr:DUF4421 family protein [Paludibacteraceae bacterium]
MRSWRWILILCLVLLAGGVAQAKPKNASAGTTSEQKEESDFMKFFFRIGHWVDNYCVKDVDTAYITLPEHPWRVAFTNSEVGIHSTFEVSGANGDIGRVQLSSVTTPSIDLGFNIGLRTLGFGYSWDALHSYAHKMNLSLGGQAWGVEFMRQTSMNIRSTLSLPDVPELKDVRLDLGKDEVWMTNTNVTAWYVFNARHYSHNAAIKQAYIQRRTAGSLLLNLSYLNTDISFGHDTTLNIPAVLDGVRKVVTHQVAVGVGYGINYTPNNGKVLIHASAAAQAVFYSINYISYEAPDSLRGFAYPSYAIKPTTPIHFTGTMRAAVSWEINKWVHLSGGLKVDNIRFRAKTDNGTAYMQNWNWQANLAVGVRLGVGRDRVNRALGLETKPVVAELPASSEQTADGKKKFVLPTWVTDYFFSPAQ